MESSFPLNTWVHWAHVYDGAGNISLYINGSRATSQTSGSSDFDFNGPEGVGIAFNMRHAADASGSNPFTYVTGIRVSNIARYSGTSYTTPTSAFSTTITTTPATGNFTSATQSASSSVSEMGIVILYKDTSGTATLNTDLVAQLSADGGSNYSTVTLESRGSFSGGLKIAVANGVSVTAGTSPKYKINFANQASGSKITEVAGVGLLY